MILTDELYKVSRVSEKDAAIIRDVLNEYHKEASFLDIGLFIKHIFGSDIKPGHYMVLGYLIGLKTSPKKQVENLNNFSLWLKPN